MAKNSDLKVTISAEIVRRPLHMVNVEDGGTLGNVLAQVKTEREYQDKKWGGVDHDDMHKAEDWISYIVKHMGKAVVWPLNPYLFRICMIRVAALAVAAAEWSERIIVRMQEAAKTPPPLEMVPHLRCEGTGSITRYDGAGEVAGGDVCWGCDGTGYVERDPSALYDCAKCKGSGSTPAGETCGPCDGTGQVTELGGQLDGPGSQADDTRRSGHPDSGKAPDPGQGSPPPAPGPSMPDKSGE